MADTNQNEEPSPEIDRLEAEIDVLEKRVAELEDERDELNKKLSLAEDALDTIQSTAKDALRAI